MTLKIPIPENLRFILLGYNEALLKAMKKEVTVRRHHLPAEEVDAKLQDWVITNFHKNPDFTIHDITKETDLKASDITYYMRFKKLRFRNWKMYLKLEASKSMLLDDPDSNIGEIIVRLGFKDKANFHRQFRRAFGCTPKHWRDCGGIPEIEPTGGRASKGPALP